MTRCTTTRGRVRPLDTGTARSRIGTRITLLLRSMRIVFPCAGAWRLVANDTGRRSAPRVFDIANGCCDCRALGAGFGLFAAEAAPTRATSFHADVVDEERRRRGRAFGAEEVQLHGLALVGRQVEAALHVGR